MKGNLHKKMMFDDGDVKKYITTNFSGWREWKKRRRRTVRRKMNKQTWYLLRED